MINYKDGILFIHIPKNAGTSVANALEFKSTSHITASEILYQNPALLKNSFSFCIVRNPFERFLSLYYYAKLEKSYYHDNINPQKSLFGKHEDYGILKNSSIEKCARLLIENKLVHDRSWNHWLPQHTWIYDEKGKNCLVKKIYRINDLEILCHDLEKHTGFNIFIPKLNVSKDFTYQRVINKKTKEILEEYYKRDFELFDYQF